MRPRSRITLLCWTWICCALSLPAQFTFSLPAATGGSAHLTPDGGFVIPHRANNQFSYAKFDSNAVFQYGYQFQNAYAANKGVQRFGKVFTQTGTSNYHVDLVKVDMATGVVEAHKRIEGPTGGVTYFSAGPADIIATQDSGLLLALHPNQCYHIAACDVCHLKLDKHLNYQFFTVGFLSNATSLSLTNILVVENADGSFTHARNVYVTGLGTVAFLARFSGTNGSLLASRVIHPGGLFAPIVSGLSTHGNEVLLAGQDNVGNIGWLLSSPGQSLQLGMGLWGWGDEWVAKPFACLCQSWDLSGLRDCAG